MIELSFKNRRHNKLAEWRSGAAHCPSSALQHCGVCCSIFILFLIMLDTQEEPKSPNRAVVGTCFFSDTHLKVVVGQAVACCSITFSEFWVDKQTLIGFKTLHTVRGMDRARTGAGEEKLGPYKREKLFMWDFYQHHEKKSLLVGDREFKMNVLLRLWRQPRKRRFLPHPSEPQTAGIFFEVLLLWVLKEKLVKLVDPFPEWGFRAWLLSPTSVLLLSGVCTPALQSILQELLTLLLTP